MNAEATAPGPAPSPAPAFRSTGTVHQQAASQQALDVRAAMWAKTFTTFNFDAAIPVNSSIPLPLSSWLGCLNAPTITHPPPPNSCLPATSSRAHLGTRQRLCTYIVVYTVPYSTLQFLTHLLLHGGFLLEALEHSGTQAHHHHPSLHCFHLFHSILFLDPDHTQ